MPDCSYIRNIKLFVQSWRQTYLLRRRCRHNRWLFCHNFITYSKQKIEFACHQLNVTYTESAVKECHLRRCRYKFRLISTSLPLVCFGAVCLPACLHVHLSPFNLHLNNKFQLFLYFFLFSSTFIYIISLL